MSMTLQELKKWHKLSMYNREGIEASERCGCFYCRHVWDPKLEPIKKWTDGQRTALCPHCGIDSVLPSATCPQAADKKFLAEMEAHWFAEVC